MRRVVITGLGALTPIGNDVQSYMDALMEGKSGADRITHFDPTHFKTQFACEVKNFDPADHLDRREWRRVDPYVWYALTSTQQAMADAGLDLEKVDLDRAGVIWGTGIGGFHTLEHDLEEAASFGDKPRYSPFLIPKLIADIAAGHISIKYGFRGINYATVSACASSSHAMINAVDYIRLNKADIFITGGSEAAVTKAGIGGFSSMKALSTRNDAPQKASRPFDQNRDGFVLGEGAGSLVFEEYEHAKARGAKIYAEVIGGAMTADAYHITAPHPEGFSVSNVMRLALQDGQIEPSDIDYINVHGTSTPLGDIAEVKAIENVFGESAYNLNISSTKSMTGHLLGAAGAIEAIACLAAIQRNEVPPTINNETRDDQIDEKLNLTLNTSQKRAVNCAMSNTFGFGGHNTSIIFRKI